MLISSVSCAICIPISWLSLDYLYKLLLKVNLWTMDYSKNNCSLIQRSMSPRDWQCTHKHKHTVNANIWKHTADSHQSHFNLVNKEAARLLPALITTIQTFVRATVQESVQCFKPRFRPPRLSHCATQRRPVPSAAECIMPRWTAIRQGAGNRAGCQMKQRVASLCSSLYAC